MVGQLGENEGLVEDIIQTVAPEHPLYKWDLTIEMDISYEGGVIVYAVRVVNRSDETVRKITITPDIDEDMFSMRERSKTLGPLPSGSAQTALFRMNPREEEQWDMGVEGHVMGGRDIALKGLLQVSGGEITYDLEVENNKEHSVRFLKVRPVLPRDFVSLEEEKTINLLKPGESKKVSFELMSRDEWEMLRRHEEGLKKPWLFSPSKPRRKKRGYPRSYTKEEMAEIKRFLLFTEADEELLKLIGDRGLDEDAIEVGHILVYREVIEEDSVEEDFALRKYRIGEPMDEDVIEMSFDLRPGLRLPIKDEEAIEMDFDIEELKDVRPLDLQGAQVEDIELEPMEMDF